jgi:hypothetical protein
LRSRSSLRRRIGSTRNIACRWRNRRRAPVQQHDREHGDKQRKGRTELAPTPEARPLPAVGRHGIGGWHVMFILCRGLGHLNAMFLLQPITIQQASWHQRSFQDAARMDIDCLVKGIPHNARALLNLDGLH